MKEKSLLFLFTLFSFLLASCDNAVSSTGEGEDSINENSSSGDEEKMKLKLEIKDFEFDVMLEENDATEELIEMARKEPITINFEDYGGFEKVGSLGISLKTDDAHITTKPGDIVLYLGNRIVMFYGSNTWSYTMLGHVEDLTYWEEALGDNEVVATFTLSE